MRKSWKIILILSTVAWVLAGIYGVIFNPTYIDEAKYLIKGWLIVTGQISYYLTENFFYQHMPGSLLWFGLGQKLFGPSLLVGRLQSFLIGLLVFGCSFLLGKRLIGKKGGVITLAFLSLAPVTALYYSAAVPQSLAAAALLLGFIFLYDGLVKKSEQKFLLASVFFSLTFLIRENFLFTLILYLGLVLYVYKNKLKYFLKHLLLVIVVLGIFVVPGYPGTIAVLNNFPGVSFLLPISQSEKEVLSLYWKNGLQTPGLSWRAIREFGEIFFAWILIGGIAIIYLVKKKPWQSENHKASQKLFWIFLIGVTAFNFAIHTWAAFKLSPRAIISYFAYIAPLIAVILSAMIIPKIKNGKKLLIAYIILLLLTPVGVRFARIFAIPVRNPDLRLTFESAKKLKPLVVNKNKILWLGEPMSLYLAGKVSYYPLINHTGFYKNSEDTATIRRLGFWNKQMLSEWLAEADLVVIEANKMNLLKEVTATKNLTDFIDSQLQQNFELLDKKNDLWPKGLSFYQP